MDLSSVLQSVITLIVGAVFGYWLSMRQLSRRAFIEKRLDAVVDFVSKSHKAMRYFPDQKASVKTVTDDVMATIDQILSDESVAVETRMERAKEQQKRVDAAMHAARRAVTDNMKKLIADVDPHMAGSRARFFVPDPLGSAISEFLASFTIAFASTPYEQTDTSRLGQQLRELTDKLRRHVLTEPESLVDTVKSWFVDGEKAETDGRDSDAGDRTEKQESER